MKLYIAEKHSVGTAIARALKGPAEKRGNCIECPNGIVVTWLAGHLLRLAEPEEYDASRWKGWSLALAAVHSGAVQEAAAQEGPQEGGQPEPQATRGRARPHRSGDIRRARGRSGP